MTTIPTKTRLTKRAVEALPTPTREQGERVVWDADLVGFGLRCCHPAVARTSCNGGPSQDARSA